MKTAGDGVLPRGGRGLPGGGEGEMYRCKEWVLCINISSLYEVIKFMRVCTWMHGTRGA